jgi:hypothetical protein
MSNFLKKLLYWNWTNYFHDAIAPKQVYQNKWFLEKLEKCLFFNKMDVEIFPSYNFWYPVEHYFDMYPLVAHTWEEKCTKDFLESQEMFLKSCIFASLVSWNTLPQCFRDFYKFYPKFELTFGEEEFVYLDFWIQLPKVLDSLLGELLVRDVPLREPFVEPSWYTFFDNIVIFPSTILSDSLSSKEELHKHITEYLTGEEPESYFFKVIHLYLNARSLLKNDCIKDLQAKGLVITDEALVKEFLGYYIFKGVGLEGLRFCVANMELKEKNPFKAYRATEVKKWEALSVERQNAVVAHATKAFERKKKEAEADALLTHNEKVKRYHASITKADDAWKDMKVTYVSVTELFPSKE